MLIVMELLMKNLKMNNRKIKKNAQSDMLI